MNSISRTPLRALLALALAACSSHPDPGVDPGFDGGNDPGEDAHVSPVDSSPDLGLGLDPGACPTAEYGSLWGRVYDQETFDPLASVSVCVLNHPELACATSDSGGIYALPCVPMGDAELEYRAGGYPRELWAWSSRQGIVEDVNLGILHEANHVRFLAPTGETYPDGARSLVTMLFVGGSAVDGATVAMRRGTGAGPFYTRYEGGTLDPAITSVANDREFAYFLAQAMPGEHEIELTITPGPGATECTQYYGGWLTDDAAPSTMRVPVEPDAVSVIFIRCE